VLLNAGELERQVYEEGKIDLPEDCCVICQVLPVYAALSY
jgi:hypothetical protein